MTEYTFKNKKNIEVYRYRDLFKKLIIYNFLIFIVTLIYVFFFQSKKVENINEYLFENFSTFEMVLIFIFIFVHLVSFYFLFVFKKIGTTLFTLSLVGVLILTLFQPVVFDGIEYALDTVSSILSGGILILMYFTNLRKEFR